MPDLKTITRNRCLRPAAWALLFLLLAPVCRAGDFTQLGFWESGVRFFPQPALNDRAQVVAGSLLRYEPSYKAGGGLTFFGSFDARIDSHHETARDGTFFWWDRTPRRPLFAVRRLSAAYRRGPVTLELGKQFIRWGKTDILNPTDRFAPKDYLTVLDSDYLAVTAARLTLQKDSDTLDLVYLPRLTPSRIPLLDQRWTVAPPEISSFPLRDGGGQYPGGPQFGIRWNRTGSRLEYSFSFYQGYHHQPRLLGQLLFPPPRIEVRREYPKLRTFGGDLAMPMRWFTLKAETGALISNQAGVDDYLLYVVQLERQWKEWLFVGGYAGDAGPRRSGSVAFAADRGLADAFLGRASVTLDATRSLIFEGLVRQDGRGKYVKVEYSQSFGGHWRASVVFAGIRGSSTDFVGQYRRNSFVSLILRYSF